MPCIGEQLKDREANKTDEVCFNQMKAISGTVGSLIIQHVTCQFLLNRLQFEIVFIINVCIPQVFKLYSHGEVSSS